MSFKPVQPKARKKEEQEDAGPISAELLNTVEAEVSKESAPLLEFLVRNIRLIGLCLVLFIVLVAGFGIYRWQDAKSTAEARNALGSAIVSGSGEEQLQNVLNLAQNAPSDLRTSAYLEAAFLAHGQGNMPAAATAWGEVAKSGAALGFSAQLNQARALQAEGKFEEAARLYQSLSASAEGGVKDALNYYAAAAWSDAAATSESARTEAIEAYEVLINSPTVDGKDFYRFCIARLNEAS